MGARVGRAARAALAALTLHSTPALATPTSAEVADVADVNRTAAALADLAHALLRGPEAVNAVVSPLATAVALGLVHAGASGAAEHEIETLFGARPLGARVMRQTLPTLLRQLPGTAGAASPLSLAARIWVDTGAAASVPAAYAKRLAGRWRADAVRLPFAQSEAAREQINHWTAQRTDGRIPQLLPAGSVNATTRVALTAAVHFRSAWEKPFDAARTGARPFKTAGGEDKPVATMVDERGVLQARVEGHLVLEIPFASAGGPFALLIAVPDEATATAVSLTGAQLARWRAALVPVRCELALPRFSILPRSGSLKTALQAVGVKTVFTDAADLRPMLGRRAAQLHLDDVHHAAGITIDEHGGVAVAAVAATLRAKSLVLPAPPCAADRAFAFAVVHQPTGTPVFVGRLSDPTQAE